MKIVTLLKGLINSLYASIKRFPAAIGLSTTAAVLLMILTHNNTNFSENTKEIIGRVTMVIALGIPVSLCIKLLFERLNIVLMIKIGIYLLGTLCLVLYYFFLLKDFEMVSVTRYIGLSLSFYLAFLFIPYLLERDSFELYVIKLLTRFFITAIYSLVMFLGIVAILFTIDNLLEIRIEYEIYYDVWLGVVGIFASSFFLAGVPTYKEQFETSSYPKLLKVLLLYIVMPLASVYTAILYIYFAKIIITLQWPVGLVAHLVLWYSVICTMLTFLITPLYEENKWAKTFTFWLSKLIIPLILMMFLSIGIRVKAYGITENRYFVIVLGLWSLGVMVYLNFVRSRRNIMLLVSLSLIAFLSVTGPWSSYSISKLSQNQRLAGILMRNDMLKNNLIVKPSQEVSKTDKEEISEILSYFNRYHELNDVKYLPADFTLSQTNDVFGFPFTESSNNRMDKNFFDYDSGITNNPIDIKGYDYMFRLNSYGSPVTTSGNDFVIKHELKNQEVKILYKNKEMYNRSMLDFVKQLYNKYPADKHPQLDTNEMTFADENENIKVKFIFNNIHGYKDAADDGIIINSMELYVLVSIK